ncbi:MAG: sigma-54 dependent transcriptional regulator [Candidatus Omnitrophota bacterium]
MINENLEQSILNDERRKPISILVVDDDPVVRDILQKILLLYGYFTVAACDAASAIKEASRQLFDIALLDDQLPDLNGVLLIGRLKQMNPQMLFIIITGYGTIERAVEAMHAGAWDFLTKPVTSEMLLTKIQRIEEVCSLRREQNYRFKAKQGRFEFPGAVGPSKAMESVYEAILRSADNNLPVLIEGETGCGKEYIAEAIHLNSSRCKKPFIIMDCTATPESLIESILFGSTKGAFTGSVERSGLLKEADGGTLFLDEVGEFAMEIQPKLLRCLETKRFRPIGSTKEIESDFRILCATNRDLKKETSQQKFRQDLYYRISAQKIFAPPLRERASDIPILAQHFLDEIAAQQEREKVTIAPNAMRRMLSFSWPGNIRQLKFAIESAFFNASGGEIDESHIQLEDDRLSPSLSENDILSSSPLEKDFKSFRDAAVLDAERAYIKALLIKTDGDVRKAAEEAGLTRESLYRVLSRCGFSPSEFRE